MVLNQRGFALALIWVAAITSFAPQELTRMPKIQAVWAIDIGQAALKALKLVPGRIPDEVVAEAFDFIEYPKILSQPDADPDELVREALATFTDRNELKGCKVAIAVPGQAGLVKFIKLPPVEKKRIPDIVKFEAKQQIPFALDEVVWAYQQIGGDEEVSEEEFTMAEVGLFAMKRDQINRAILPFTVAGIEVDIVQMSPIALYNFITFDQLKGSGSKDSVVVLDIGADNTDLIITDGTRIWQRNVPIGGNHFTRALTKELKLTFAKAEHLKRNATKAPDPRAIFTAMRGVFNDFASEVNRSIGFYSSINRTAKITQGDRPGQRLQAAGPAEVPPAEPEPRGRARLEGFAKLVGDEVKAAPQFQDNLASFAVAYGLGIQGLGKGGPEHQPAAAGDRAGPADPGQEALGAGRLGPGDAGARRSVHAGRLPRCWPRSRRPQFKTAVDAGRGGQQAGQRDQDRASRRPRATGKPSIDEGKALIVDPTDRGMWPRVPQDDQQLIFPDPDPRLQARPRRSRRPGRAREAAGPHRRDQARLADRPGGRVVRPARPEVQEADAPLRREQPPHRRGLGHPDRLPPLQPLSHRPSSRRITPERSRGGPSSAPTSSSPRRCCTS